MRGKRDIDEIARRYGVESSFVEQMRFSKLDPSGVGTINDIESMIFQLDDFSLDKGIIRLDL